MDKLTVSQILKLLLIAAVLLVTPLISSSQRTPYLYFIVNLLIIALGAEAGLLSFFSESSNDKDKPADTITTKGTTKQQISAPSVTKVVEKCASEKIFRVTKVEKDATKIQKCPSTPSLFFIDGVENSEAKDDEVVKQKLEEDEEKEELLGELSGQELFNKAETFIGNFYNQLKMQREEPWSRFNDFYQKTL